MKHLLRFCSLFFLATSPCLYSYQDADLEQMIIDTNIEGVKVALSKSQLTPQEKMGLLGCADDMIINRVKEREWWMTSPTQPFGSEVGGVFIALCSLLGFLPTPCFFFPEFHKSLKIRLIVGLGAIAANCAVFTAGCLLARYGRKKLEQYVKDTSEKFVKTHVDAVKIKKLINDAL